MYCDIIFWRSNSRVTSRETLFPIRDHIPLTCRSPFPDYWLIVYLVLCLVFRIIYHLVFHLILYFVFYSILCFVVYLVFCIICCLPGKVYIRPLLASIKKCASLTELHQ